MRKIGRKLEVANENSFMVVVALVCLVWIEGWSGLFAVHFSDRVY